MMYSGRVVRGVRRLKVKLTAGLVGMVGAAILVLVLEDGGVEGGGLAGTAIV
jgi:hypothetical protein